MEFFSCSGQARRCGGTLVVPALSIGNAGQLAVDLLISSLNARRVGYLDDPFVLPCIGNDPFGPKAEGKLAVALELYEDPRGDLTILQQRSPTVKGAMVKFSQDLAEWAKKEDFDQIVVLSGLDSGRKKLVFQAPQVHYVSAAGQDGIDPRCEALGWKRLSGLPLSTDRSLHFDFNALKQALPDSPEDDERRYFTTLPAAAVACASKAKGLNVLCLFCYCAEGDNVPDAYLLANAVDKLLHSSDGAECQNWRVPLSWSTIYGPPPDESMY